MRRQHCREFYAVTAESNLTTRVRTRIYRRKANSSSPAESQSLGKSRRIVVHIIFINARRDRIMGEAVRRVVTRYTGFCLPARALDSSSLLLRISFSCLSRAIVLLYFQIILRFPPELPFDICRFNGRSRVIFPR